MKKKERCHYCGQEVDRKIWVENAIRIAKKSGLPSLAKLLKGIKLTTPKVKEVGK